MTRNLVVQLFSSASTKLTSCCTITSQLLPQVRRQSRSKFLVDFQVITVNFLFVLNACKANVVSLYFRLNCVIKLNTVLPSYWFFGLLFDGTKGIIINKNSNI